ncbi:MAG: type II toxin-antitoxin system VapC family toxin [Betaproteobacteria bacterium]|nr:type II toxin-antitoxin system VapC family toxin [Betaproteobacteria bacterium]
MIYLDTSVAVTLLVPEPKTADVKAWFAGLSDILVSGDWLLTEFESAISIKVRSGELSEASAKAVRKEFGKLTASGLRIVPVSRAVFRDAAGMAQQHTHRLRAGDALHLAVAKEIGAKSIATLDSVMSSNAKRLKMNVEAI